MSAFTHALSTNNYGCAAFIVDANAANGTHTTIQAAITAAVSGQTVFVRPGTYTENLTMKAGVNLASYDCDSFTPNVSIVGTLACSYSGTVSISGIRLTTNSANIISLTGANVTIFNMYNGYLNCTNNTGISSTGSNAGSQVNIFNCTGALGTTGIAYHTVTNGTINFVNCFLNNSGGSTTASTCSGSTVSYRSSSFGHVVTTSGTTANLLMINSQNDCSAINTTAINANATFATPNQIANSRISSGSATPISIGSGATCVIANSSLDSSNGTAVTGAGILVYGGVVQTSTVGTLSATTLTPKFVQGALNSTAPPAGVIGEIITGSQSSGTSMSVNTVANLTSITLTPGIWDVSGTINVLWTTGVGVTSVQGCLSTVNNAFTNIDSNPGMANNTTRNSEAAPATSVFALMGPARVSIAANTTYFLNAFLAATSASVITGKGFIRGTRVA